MARFGCVAGGTPEPDAQAGVVGQAHDGARQGVGVIRGYQQARLVVGQHLGDLAHATGDDWPAHGHVLEELGRRTEELASVGLATVRRDQHIAGSQVLRDVRVRHQAWARDAGAQTMPFDGLVYGGAQWPIADQQPAHVGARRQHQRQCTRERRHAVPGAKGARETDHHIRAQSELTPHAVAAQVGTVHGGIDAVGVHDDLRPGHARGHQFPA